MVQNLTKFMLHDQRQYVIDKIKAPMIKAFIILANRLKIEPSKENTYHPNSLVWIDIWDKFLAMEDNPQRESLFRAIRKIWIAECEHDIYYRDRMNVILELWLEEVLKGNWKPRSADHPNFCWKVDPNIRGIGYEFMKERFYHKEKYNIDN